MYDIILLPENNQFVTKQLVLVYVSDLCCKIYSYEIVNVHHCLSST